MDNLDREFVSVLLQTCKDHCLKEKCGYQKMCKELEERFKKEGY